MMYLFYGENRNRVRETLGRFIERLRRDVPSSWHMIECAEENAASVLAGTLGAGSLFSKKDFFVIKSASGAGEEVAELLEPHIARWAKDDSVVVFAEMGVPIKNKLFENIKKHAKSEEFLYPSASKASRVIDESAKKSGVAIPSAAKKTLLDIAASSPERFLSELEKVMLGGVSAEVGEHIRENEVFVLGDLWGTRAKRSALMQYHQFLEAGFEPDAVLRALVWHVKNLCLAAHGRTNDMKPFVAQKARQQARNFSPDALDNALFALVKMSDMRAREFIETRLLHFLLTT